jgi:predicted dehydrogenase
MFGRMETVRVGGIGCGAISSAYWEWRRISRSWKLRPVPIWTWKKPRAQGEKFQISKVCQVDELLNDKSIEIVLNLTVPKAHVPVAIQALSKGKHTYAEKPLGVDREDGARAIKLARDKKLYIGCAPDTFMGAGIQTARKAIDDGLIGRPLAFTAFMLCPGHESWHPSPEFYYEVGGGPMFDMGPYYLTALLNLLGPVKRLMAWRERRFPSAPSPASQNPERK